MSFSAGYRETLIQTLSRIDAAKVEEAIQWMRETRDQGRAIFVAGNGGSAATAAHFVCDMVKGASMNRPSRFRIQALGSNLATLTAYSNDLSYADALTEELRNFAQPGDLYMAISGSGSSPNVVRAMEFANKNGCRTIALTGKDGGLLGGMAKLHIHVPEPHMGRIEDAHHIVCHMICYSFMDQEYGINLAAATPASSKK